LETGDEVIFWNDQLCTYMRQIALQSVGGIDKRTDAFLGYFSAYSEISPDTMMALTGTFETGYLIQRFVATGDFIDQDVCAIVEEGPSTCSPGTPRMRGGRCDATGLACLSDQFCVVRAAGDRCEPNPGATLGGVSHLVVPETGN
jgi:hypothetical protein